LASTDHCIAFFSTWGMECHSIDMKKPLASHEWQAWYECKLCSV
jgi:hypothetical protein